MRTQILCVTLGVIVSSASSWATADDTAKDLEKLQGTWAAVTYIQNGEGEAATFPAAASPVKWQFKGDKILFLADLEEAIAKGSFKLDASKALKTIDVIFPPAPGSKRDQKLNGIYKIDSGTLTVCYHSEGGKRPEEFKSKSGSMTILVTFKQLAK